MADNMTASQYARGRARLKQMAMNLYDVVKLNEGFKTKAYKDTKGNMTIGVGFNLESPINRKYLKDTYNLTYDDLVNKGVELNETQIKKLYDFSMENALEDALIFDPKLLRRPENVRLATLDLAFNLGRLKLLGGIDSEGKEVVGFDNMRAALANDDYETAAAEMKNSNWFSQVKTRGPRMVNIMKSQDSLTNLLKDIRSKK